MAENLSKKSRGLGRGLNALFEDEETGFEGQAANSDSTPTPSGSKRQSIGVEMLTPGTLQPRQVFDEEALAQLAESIASHGLLQPLLVRVHPEDSSRFEIIAGERRWRAAQKAQLHEVPVIVLELEDVEALEIGLIENLQREDLNPIEEAEGYQRLIAEYGHTQEKLASSLGKSRPHIANMIRLLKLPESVQADLQNGKLSIGHARALITADNPEALAKQIIAGNMSVREAESLAASAGGKSSKAKKKPGKDVDTLALEDSLSSALGMKVVIDTKANGKGTLKVSYGSLDQLDEVIARLSGTQNSRLSS